MTKASFGIGDDLGVTLLAGMAAGVARTTTARAPAALQLASASDAESARVVGIVGESTIRRGKIALMTAGTIELTTAEWSRVIDDLHGGLIAGAEYELSGSRAGCMTTLLHRQRGMARWHAKIGVALSPTILRIEIGKPWMNFDGLVVESVWVRRDASALAFAFDDGSEAIFDVPDGTVIDHIRAHSFAGPMPHTRAIRASLVGNEAVSNTLEGGMSIRLRAAFPRSEVPAMTWSDFGPLEHRTAGRLTMSADSDGTGHVWSPVHLDGETSVSPRFNPQPKECP